MSDLSVRDPTHEQAAEQRARRAPTIPPVDARVGLFSIAKERSNEFMDTLATLLDERGIATQRFAKATHTKTAAEAVLAAMVAECDVVVGALAD